jgi:hypothetical protein
VSTDVLREQLKKDEAKLTEKLSRSLSHRKQANAMLRETGEAMNEARGKLDEEMEALREKLRPYLDGRKAMDKEAVAMASRYSRMVRDMRHLTAGPDLCSEAEAAADLGEIGPESDGLSSYRNQT